MSKLRALTLASVLAVAVAAGCSSSDQAAIDKAVSATLAAAQPATATPTATPTPVSVPTDTPTPEPTIVPNPNPEPTATNVPTPVPTDTSTPEPTIVPNPNPEPTATQVPTTTLTVAPTLTATLTPRSDVECEAADPDEYGNVVHWCDDGSHWWINSVTGYRHENDASGNRITGILPSHASTATSTGLVVDLSETHSIGYDWGRNPSIFSVSSDTGDCAEKSEFSVDKLSSQSRTNLELITGMNIADITTVDLSALTQLDALGLISYDGLKYLTCVQWLSLGWEQPQLSRDFRFLKSLTEIRYLDLSNTAFKDVELLLPLKKLETLVLPHGFQAVSDLTQITSLRRISVAAGRTCSSEPVLNMPNLETLHLGGKTSSGAGSYHQWTELDELNRDFNISFSPSGQYLQLLIEGGAQAFNSEPFSPESPNSYQDPQYVMDVVQSIYEIVEDDYDVIVFVGNAETSTASYSGQASQISNNTEGLGTPIWSTAECHGSAGRLRGVITLPSIGSLWTEEFGTANILVHEMLHLWGGADLLPVIENFEGTFTGGHWGVSSANGLLGGFNAKDLETIDDGVYRTNYFSGKGNQQPERSLSALELYMMGVLPVSEVPDVIVFSGVSKLNDKNTCEDYDYEWWDGTCFRATGQTSVSIEDIIDVFGERPYEGELDISTLVVAVSEGPLTSSEWFRLDQHISRFADTKPRDDLCHKLWGTCNNMWAASEGKILIEMSLD
ncbi:MAG: procyclic acidic repetitive family protein [Dehalococcoidia bacterium]|nr:procyclic acidic repetitive family protein [Dehalococcoidia bacterium]